MTNSTFELEEVVILFDALLDVIAGKTSRKDAIKLVSAELRNRRIQRGEIISDSFRSENGISTQFFYFKELFLNGQQTPGHGLAPIFQEVIDLYSNNREKYDVISANVKQSISHTTETDDPFYLTAFENWFKNKGFNPYSAKIYVSRLTQIFNCLKEISLEDNFLEFWGRDESETNAIIDAIFECEYFNHLSDASLKQYQSSLRKYIEFRRQTSQDQLNVLQNEWEEPEESEQEDDVPADGIQDEEVDNDEDFYEIELDRNCKLPEEAEDFKYWQSSQGVNESTAKVNTRCVVKIALLVKKMGLYDGDILKIYDVELLESIQKRLFEDKGFCRYNIKKHHKFSAGFAKFIEYLKEEQSESESPEGWKLVNANLWSTAGVSDELVNFFDIVRDDYATGFSFGPATQSLVEERLGYSIASLEFQIKKYMFERSDGYWFLNEEIASEEIKSEIEATADNFLKNPPHSFDMNKLYLLFKDRVNSVAIRDAKDFEDWSSKFLYGAKTRNFDGLRLTFLSSWKKDDLKCELLDRIRSEADERYGTLEENDIETVFEGFTLDALRTFIQKYAEDLVIKEINEVVCIQTLEGLGLGEDFSKNVYETLEKLDELEIEPTLSSIHAVLSVAVGENIMKNYDIPDEKTLQKLIEIYYNKVEGCEPRKWRSGVFGKEE